MNTFYSKSELKSLGLHSCGSDVLISRNAIIYNPELVDIGNHVRIDDYVTISGTITIGNYVHIAQACNIYGGSEGVIMEDYSGLSARVLVYATSNDYSGDLLTNPTLPDECVGDYDGLVRLGKYVVVGCASVVLPGVTIGEGSAIGALSLCMKDLDEWGIYAGIPAKRIKDRKKGLVEKARALEASVSEKYLKLKVGDSASLHKRITSDYIESFAMLTGDLNPIHLDDAAANESPFGGRIAHGMISGGLISAVIGTKMPGFGTVYLEQNIRFLKPIYVDDECIATVTVSEVINSDKGIYRLDTFADNGKGERIAEGYAVVKTPENRKRGVKPQ